VSLASGSAGGWRQAPDGWWVGGASRPAASRDAKAQPRRQRPLCLL